MAKKKKKNKDWLYTLFKIGIILLMIGGAAGLIVLGFYVGTPVRIINK